MEGDKERATTHFLSVGLTNIKRFQKNLHDNYLTIEILEESLRESLSQDFSDSLTLWSQRKYSQKKEVQWIVWGNGLIVLFLAAMFAYWRISRPLILLSKTMGLYAKGNTETPLAISSRQDEIGDMSRSLQVFAQVFKENVQSNSRLQKTLKDNERLSQTIESNPTGLWVANELGEILYCNHSARQYIEGIDSTLEKSSMDVTSGKLRPDNLQQILLLEQQRNTRLSDIKSPLNFLLNRNSQHFHISIRPIIDHQGERIGFSCEWNDRTQEVNIEQEIAQLVHAATAGDLSTRVVLKDKTGF